MKPITLILGIAILAGCATSKPPLPEHEYQAFAERIVGIKKCAVAGQLSPDDASLGWQYVRGNLETYTYEDARMRSLVNGMADRQDPSHQWCVDTAMHIAAYKRNLASNQQAQAAPVEVSPTRTYCNRIGNQTLCSSY